MEKSKTPYKVLPSEEDEEKGSIELEKDSLADKEETPRVSWAWIYTLSIATFGISGAWSLELAVTTPYFETGLKAGRVLSHIVWLAGPLSGLIVAPIVGALSDRCTSRYGRRRPFILAGIVSTVIGMIVYSQARRIAALFFSEGTSEHKFTAISIAVVAFCVTDLAINTTMWPIRALQGDLVPDFQQHDLQSASVVLGSLGDLAANYLVHAFEAPVSKIGTIFLFAAVFYALTTSTLLFVGKEEPLDADDPSIVEAARQPANIIGFFKGIPKWLWRIGITYSLGFFALFCCMPYMSSWVGESVLGGDPDGEPGSELVEKYERGVNLYGRAGLMRALVMMIFSGIYPKLLNWISPGQLMALTYGTFGASIIALASTRSATVGQFVVILLGLPQAAEFTVPVGMTVAKSDASNRGRYLGSLNIFAVIPQLIDTFYTGYVSKVWGETAVMRIGGIWALLTAVSALLFMWV